MKKILEFFDRFPRHTCKIVLLLFLLFSIIVVRAIYFKSERHRIIFGDDYDDEKLVKDDTQLSKTPLLDTGDPRKMYADAAQLNRNPESLSVRNLVKKANEEIKIPDIDITAWKTTVVIVVQIDYEVFSVQKMVESLCKVKGINKTIVIFSHNYYGEDIIQSIYNASITNHIEIFYPYSTQIYSKVYPGDDGKYCAKNYDCFLDSNRRRPEYAQEKLFWWWQLNYVFDHLDSLVHFDGFFLFLKYNQIVAENMLTMFYKMRLIVLDICSDCDMISLGAYSPRKNILWSDTENFFYSYFGSTDNNIAFAFNRSTWNKIKALRQHFCHYNDYRWDRSFKYLATKMPKGKFVMLSCERPRVLSAEDENINELSDDGEKYLGMLKTARPRKVKIKYDRYYGAFSVGEYWDDVRDADFCMFLSEPAAYRFMEEIDF